MYAIINTRTKKFVYGTDYSHYPYTQRTSTDQMETYGDMLLAVMDFRKRKCGKDYKIVRVEVSVHELNEQDKEDMQKAIKWLES